MSCAFKRISPSKRAITVLFVALLYYSVIGSVRAAAAINVTVTPSTMALTPLAMQTLTATVSGATNQAVSWSLAPKVGGLTTAGNTAVYVAPAIISSNQTVTLTATSAADSTKHATAMLQLAPLVTIAVSPGAATLQPTGKQQFAATVLGTGNTGVKWSVQPAVGTISTSGLYTAPASLSGPQTVTVTAQSAQDATKTATAQVHLTPGVFFQMGTAGLTSLKWNNQEFLYQGLTSPSFAQVYLGTRYTSTTPTQTVTNPQTGTVSQTFAWGRSTTQYQALGNKLMVTVTLNNTSSQTINGFWMFPLGVQFPVKPANWASNMTFNLDAPSSVWWNYPGGAVDLVNEDIAAPLALGFWQAENPAATRWLISLNVDPTQSINPNWPAINRPIAPGATDTFTTSLRFGPQGATEMQLAGDIYARFASTYPRIFTAPAARKPLARLSFTGAFRPTQPKNPRGWLNDPSIDVTTPQGIASFQSKLLSAADTAIAEMTRVGAAGGIIWDIEGQQLPQSFIGDPSQAEALAPELVGVLDAFVAKFKAAGFPIGFTIRPQVFSAQSGTVNVSGKTVTWVSGSQFSPAWVQQPYGGSITIGRNNYTIASVSSPTSLTLATSAGNATATPYLYGLQTFTGNQLAVLQAKVKYATQRWGATLFYVDSCVDDNNITPAVVFQQLVQAFPGTRYFPEWKTPRDYAYTYGFLDATNNITSPGSVALNIYPNAAGLIRVPADGQIARMQNTLINAVSAGNILLFDGWFRHPGNDIVSLIYALAP